MRNLARPVESRPQALSSSDVVSCLVVAALFLAGLLFE